ncbi:hypothetical protein STPH1_6772 [Streptomyces sp. OM5714]|nr:hypothetical protein STPH1_6772 [Streptomyces sp. OM5714]
MYLVCTATMIGTGLGAAPASSVPLTHVVHPGESIQKAVDAADAGDTVLVTPGVYHESVKVSTPGLTLRGTGRSTVIMPSTKKAADNTCAEGGNGICVIGTKDENVKGITVSDLTVTGFTRTGVFSMATDGLTVRNVNAVKNGVWGIAQERSVHGVIRGNTARDNGDAGIFLANNIKAEEGAADTEGTLVAHNRLEGNRIGVTVRRLRNLAVADNHITGNCAGVFVVGDENTPKAGDLVVRDNHVVRNNKSHASAAGPLCRGPAADAWARAVQASAARRSVTSSIRAPSRARTSPPPVGEPASVKPSRRVVSSDTRAGSGKPRVTAGSPPWRSPRTSTSRTTTSSRWKMVLHRTGLAGSLAAASSHSASSWASRMPQPGRAGYDSACRCAAPFSSPAVTWWTAGSAARV